MMPTKDAVSKGLARWLKDDKRYEIAFGCKDKRGGKYEDIHQV